MSYRSFRPGRKEEFRVMINCLEKTSPGVKSVTQRPINEH